MKNKQHEPKFGEVSSKWREIDRKRFKGKPVTAEYKAIYKLAFYCGVMYAIQMSREFVKERPTTFAEDILVPGVMQALLLAGWPKLRKDFKGESDAQLAVMKFMYKVGGMAAVCESLTRVKDAAPEAADALLKTFSDEVYAYIQTMR